MKKVIGILIAVLFVFTFSFFSKPEKGKINWISFEELKTAYAKEPRPIMVDLYTSWCGWCKEMDRTTYKNEKLASYINEHYYAVKFDAESKEVISFNEKTYGYNPQYRVNELAFYLSGGQLEYPTTVFLTGLDARPSTWSGYLKAKEMEAPLKFFGEKKYMSGSFEDFARKMKKEW